MRRPQRLSRLILIASLGALLASFAPVAPAVLAADPAQPIRLSDEPHRTVTVRDLPEATGDTPGVDRPRLGSGSSPTGILGGSAPLPVQASTSTTPAAAEPTSFAGLARVSSEPPDPWIAVGPDHVMQAVNTTIRATDRSGGTSHPVSMYQFFGFNEKLAPGGGPYLAENSNPRITFDSVQGRWIAIESSFDCYPVPFDPTHPLDPGAVIGTGSIDVAVSRSADARGIWDVFSLISRDFFPDDLSIGTSTDKVVVSANVYGLTAGGGVNGCSPGPTLLGTRLDVLSWAELKMGGLENVDFLYTDFAPGSSFPNNYFSWRPALQTPATSATVHLIAKQQDNSGVAYATITGRPEDPGRVPLTRTDLTSGGIVAGFLDPPDPRQPGSPATIVNALDGRPTDAIWQGNRLAFVSTYPCDPAGGAAETRACVRVTELETVGTPSLTQDFLIAADGKDNYMGGVGFSRNGDLHAVWTRSSNAAGDYPSTYTAMQLPTDAPNTLGVRQSIAAGTGTYPGTRWGENVGVAQDPQVPNAVWQADEYSIGAGWWGTHVSQLQTGGSSYVPITPVRVLDTRPGITIGLAGVFSHGVARSWTVAGFGTIPANAIAVTGNLTVANQTAGGYVSVTPTSNNNPSSSTINFPVGDNRANNLTIPVNAANGKISAVYRASAGKTTHLIFDVTGYFLAGDEDGTYTTLTPVRALDTRPGINIGLSGVFTANVPRKLTLAGTNGIPADAVAISGNLTVVGQTRAGYLSITKVSDPDPATSNLNFPLGDTRANGVSVPLNGSGALWIVYKASGGSTNVILDVTGFYRNVPSGLLFYPLTPGRVMDTRVGAVLTGLAGAFSANNPRRLDIAGHWGAPASADAITGNLTVVNQTAAGYVSATLTEDANPDTSVLNFPLADTRANGATLPLNTGGRSWFVYKASAGKTTHLILDLSGYFD